MKTSLLRSACRPVACVITLLVGATELRAHELITNGSFENPAATFVNNGLGVMSLPSGSTSIPGWTTANTELIWGTNGNRYGPATPYGGFFLDLTGFHDSAPYGGVSQTIATLSNQIYRLSFSLGVDQDVPGKRGGNPDNDRGGGKVPESCRRVGARW